MGLDDLELDRGTGTTPEPLPVPGGDARWKWAIAGAVALALLVGGAARWWTMNRAAPADDRAGLAAGATDVDIPTPAVVLPPLDQMDGFLRTLLGTLSSRPELLRWLATEDLIRQMALVIDRVAQGDTPAKDLRVLAPEGEFVSTVRRRTRFVDPAGYRRYDGIAETIAGLDSGAVARGYATIKPRLNEAYQAMGRTTADVDQALVAALDVLIATPSPTGPIALVEGRGATWAFADPELEALDPAQKQLLRMGPENMARIVEKLKDVKARIQSPE
jgi:hypothetical protein